MATNDSRRPLEEPEERTMALDSMRQVLEQRFWVNIFSLGITACREGRRMYFDAFAYSSSVACVVDIRERLTEDSSERLLQSLRDFRQLFPEHRDKTVFGILAFADAPEDIRNRVLDAGIYLARIQDGQFEIQVPPDFRPRAF
ncbi:MAG TPA: hypothetical protein VF756_15200 [Thermoanaerobaculia bacterium]